jgi:hypothetical protein
MFIFINIGGVMISVLDSRDVVVMVSVLDSRDVVVMVSVLDSRDVVVMVSVLDSRDVARDSVESNQRLYNWYLLLLS